MSVDTRVAGAGARHERSPGTFRFDSYLKAFPFCLEVPGLPSQAQSSPGHPTGLHSEPEDSSTSELTLFVLVQKRTASRTKTAARSQTPRGCDLQLRRPDQAERRSGNRSELRLSREVLGLVCREPGVFQCLNGVGGFEFVRFDGHCGSSRVSIDFDVRYTRQRCESAVHARAATCSGHARARKLDECRRCWRQCEAVSLLSFSRSLGRCRRAFRCRRRSRRFCTPESHCQQQ